MTGRPTSYTPELGDEICLNISVGKSLISICKEEGMPDKSTVLLWVVKGDRGDPVYKAFSDQYRRAREAQAEVYYDEMMDIADDGSNDFMMTEFGPKLNKEFAERSKLRVHARQWALSKMLPKKYGDALKLQGDKENPIEVNHAITPSERAARLASILKLGRDRRDRSPAGGPDEVGTTAGGADSGTDEQS